MPNENASAAISERITGSIASPVDLDLIVEELAAVAGQAERERDLLLARKLAEFGQREAEHELRLVKLEQELRNRLATLRDGEKGNPGEKGEKGEQGDKGETVKGEKGDQGAPGEKGETGDRGETGEQGAPGDAGAAGLNGADGKPGERGADGAHGNDGRSFVIRDTYDPNEAYKALDVVTLNATWFIARKDDPGACPGADWKAGPTGRRGEKGERGERGPRGELGQAGREVTAWEINRKDYSLVPTLSDGTKGPALSLRALFEQFQAETA
jgi:hypothetical protein